MVDDIIIIKKLLSFTTINCKLNYAIEGVREIRRAVSGRELPNVRHIRTAIFTDVDRPAPQHNLFVMQFGQIVAHDTELTLTKSMGEFSSNIKNNCVTTVD